MPKVTKGNIVGVVQASALDVKLGKTIMGKFVGEIDNYFIERFKVTDGDNVAIPTLSVFTESIPQLKQAYIDLYNATMGLESGVENIPDNLKASQGALLDGLCYGYEIETGKYAIYTMNFNLLIDMKLDTADMAKQCMDKNKKGEVKAYRIDVKYINDPSSFSFKTVNHRKAIDDEEEVLLVPYLACARLMKIIESFMNSNMVIKTVQDKAGFKKVRCITKNEKVLSKYCDDENAIKYIEPKYFPMKAFFYAPVIGAPSTTAMVTNINLFDLTEIKKLKSVTELKKFGVEPAKNPIFTMVSETIITNSLIKLKARDIEDFSTLIHSLPKAEELFEVTYDNDVSEVMISKYLHSITNEEYKEVIEILSKSEKNLQVNVMKETERQVMFFNENREMSETELSNLYNTLKGHICKFLIQKEDCTLSSVIGTNNPEILKELYGSNYFGEYESKGVRVRAAAEEITMGRPIEMVLSDYGFESKAYDIEAFNIEVTGLEIQGMEKGKAVEQVLSDRVDYRPRTSTTYNPDILTLRTCTAYRALNEETGELVVHDYYKNIDINKVLRATILSK